MTTRKGTSKTGRAAVADRSAQLDTMAKAVQATKAGREQFMADPAAVAKQHGVTLTQEEIVAVRFLNGLTLLGPNAISKLKLTRAFFDNNCNCSGGGPITA